MEWNDVEILDIAKDLQEREVKVTLHQNGSQILLDEQRRRKKTLPPLDKNIQEL